MTNPDNGQPTLSQVLEAIQQLSQQVGGVNQRVDGLSQRVDGLTHQMGDMSQRIDSLSQRIDYNFSIVDQRFAEVNGRFAQVNDRFDALTTIIGVVDRKVDANTQAIRELAETQNSYDERLNTVYKTVVRIPDHLLNPPPNHHG